MKIFLFVLVAFMFANCGVDLSSEIGRLTVTESSKGGVYFYRIVRGLSTDAYFLSMKDDICKGLSKKEDYYFMTLGALIYYNIKGDTLFVYTNSEMKRPTTFGLVVVQKPIPQFEDEQFERMYRENKINKVTIDSIYKPGCEVVY